MKVRNKYNQFILVGVSSPSKINFCYNSRVSQLTHELQRAAPYLKSPLGEMGPLWPALHVLSAPISVVIGAGMNSNRFTIGTEKA